MTKATKKKITVEEVKTLIDKLLQVTHLLAESHPEAPKDKHYIRVIEGFYRKTTFTLLAIRYLADQPDLADSAAALCRKMTEDVISIEYMLLMGKEEMAKQFQNFLYIQAYEEREQRNQLGYKDDLPKKQLDALLAKVEKLKPQFWHEKSNSFMHSWSGKSAEQMWYKLAKAKSFNEHDIKVILLAYTYGSWKSHPNPADVLSYMTNEARTANNEFLLLQSTVFSMFAFIRLTTRYIDEIREVKQENVYEDINKIVKEILTYLDDDQFGMEKDS